MSAVKIGYNDQFQNVDYLCIQQGNVHYIRSTNSSTSIIDEEEQKERDKLIQAATNRLKQKLLENKYENLMSQIVELQSKLDIIKLETSISLKSINTNHLEHFEKRLDNHKSQLESIVNTDIIQVQQNKNNRFSYSLSSFSSTISSILSLRSTSDEEEKDYFASIGGNQQQKRRRRSSKHKEIIVHPHEKSVNIMKDTYYNDNNITKEQPSDIGRNGLLVLHSIKDNNNNSSQSDYNNNGLIKNVSSATSRNALDDTLSFLNDLASDSDDGGFRKDIIQLLDTMHHKQNLCSPTISNIQQKQKQQQQQRKQQSKCYFTRQNCFVKNALTNIVSSGWKWIRFALIMTLAILINLKKGPSLF